MSEQPNTAAGRALMDAFVSDAEAALDRGGQVLDWDGMRRRVLAIEAEARQQGGSALRLLYELSLMTRADDDTDPLFDELPVEWTDRALAALAALPPSAPPALDCTHAEGCICVEVPHASCCGALREKVLANTPHSDWPSAPPALDVELPYKAGANRVLVELMTRQGTFLQYPKDGVTEEWIAVGDIFAVVEAVARLQEPER